MVPFAARLSAAEGAPRLQIASSQCLEYSLDPTCRPHNLGRNLSSHCLNLVELTTDLLQGTQLGLIVDVVVTACLHRLYQARLELIVLCCCLTSCLSCSSFLLYRKAKLRLGVRKHVLVVSDLRLKCRLTHRIRFSRPLKLLLGPVSDVRRELVSEIWAHSLSGWPSFPDSEEKPSL